MNHYAILKWYQLSGINEVIGNLAIDRFFEFKQNQEKRSIVLSDTKKETPVKTQTNETNLSFVAKAQETASNCTSLKDLYQKLLNFDACSLKKTASNTFIGCGQEKNPTVFCVFDAPKAQADKSGNLFDGQTGELMKKMLGSIQLSDQNCFTAPLIPWRLPGDRKPTQTEEQTCLPFLKKQIELTNPEFILVFGAVATKALLQIDSISKARQQELSLTINNNTIPVITTFGPEMVSASQISRKNAWEDLKKLAQLIQNKTLN